MRYTALFATVCAMSLLASCSQSGTKATAEETEESNQSLIECELLNKDSKWRLTEYTDGTDELAQVSDDEDYYLTFSVSDSTFSISTGCNNIGGQYRIKKDSIEFDNVLVTQMLCDNMAIESAMISVVTLARTYNVDADSLLSLSYEGLPIALFEPVEE